MRIIINEMISEARTRRRAAVLVAVAALVVSACTAGSDLNTATEGISVVATTTILGDIARNIVGDDGTVVVVLPIGADPHDYRPSSAEVAVIHDADLVIANGLGLEEGFGDVLKTAAADGANLVEVAELVDPVTFSDREHCRGDGDDDHDHGNCDPHVWFDPLRAAAIAQIIGAELSLIDISVDWQARVDEYSAELIEADETIVMILDAIPDDRRILVTNHDSLGYLADRYGLQVVGTVLTGGGDLSEPSSVDLAELVSIIDATGVQAIFAETTETTALAEAVASEVGHPVAVVRLYSGSLGDPGSGADTLIGMLTTNARRIANALS